MSADKAFDKWHKRWRHLDRNDARIAWDAGREEEQRAIRQRVTLALTPEMNVPRVRGLDETNDAVGQAFTDAVAGGTGMFRTNPDGSTEHIGPDQFKLAPPAKEKA